MPNVKFRASGRTLTSHAGLSLIGQCLEIAGVDSIDGRFPTTLGMRTSDVEVLRHRLYGLLTGFCKPLSHELRKQHTHTLTLLARWGHLSQNRLQALWRPALLNL